MPQARAPYSSFQKTSRHGKLLFQILLSIRTFYIHTYWCTLCLQCQQIFTFLFYFPPRIGPRERRGWPWAWARGQREVSAGACCKSAHLKQLSAAADQKKMNVRVPYSRGPADLKCIFVCGDFYFGGIYLFWNRHICAIIFTEVIIQTLYFTLNLRSTSPSLLLFMTQRCLSVYLSTRHTVLVRLLICTWMSKICMCPKNLVCSE